MNVKNLMRLLIILLVPFACLIVAQQARRTKNAGTMSPKSAAAPELSVQKSKGATAFEKTVLPFLSENCYMCHNSELRSGSLDLKSYTTQAAVLKDRDTWQTVLKRLRAGDMPPEGMPRPDEAELKKVMEWIDREFKRADKLAKPDPGRVTTRRLNRTEYNNTVRDLLGVDFRPADDFPQDDSGYGFDNIGDVLSLSPVLMEKYMSAAERVAHTALFGAEPLKPTLARLTRSGRKIDRIPKPLFDYDLTGLSMPNGFHVTHKFPVDGEYTFRAVLGGTRPPGSEPLKIALWIDGQQAQVRTFDPATVASFGQDKQELWGMADEFRNKITAGDHWVAISFLNLFEGLPPSYNGPQPSKRQPPPPPVFKPRPGMTPQQIEEFRKRFEARRAEVVMANDARITDLEIGGPFEQSLGPSAEGLKKIYVCGHPDGHHQPDCGRKIVSNLARRAFRRPVPAQEAERFLNLVTTAQKDGDSFEAGIGLALQAILISPHFLFRIERDLPATSVSDIHPIGQHELASRLSYFLWSSMPDDELSRCADQGILRQPKVLAAQVRRMLKDEKTRALVENFGGQWLELRKLDSVKPDKERFPEFEDYLRRSMRLETEMFFESIVREDRSILDFIDGKYTFLNERLAQFYKIPEVKGPEFRRVDLTSHAHRSGILTQASILTVSSYATRTSPVLRGKWILENLLGTPPPPPPPDVPNLDEAKIGESASLRQQLEQHRTNVVCSSCHSRMDPLGFGLENFDAIGAWRTEDGKFTIDASGLLPDGRSFKGPNELKAILRSDSDIFARGLTEKLLTYALGRGLESYDKRTVDEIADRLAANKYSFSSLVQEIVSSHAFQMRRGGDKAR